MDKTSNGIKRNAVLLNGGPKGKGSKPPKKAWWKRAFGSWFTCCSGVDGRDDGTIVQTGKRNGKETCQKGLETDKPAKAISVKAVQYPGDDPAATPLLEPSWSTEALNGDGPELSAPSTPVCAAHQEEKAPSPSGSGTEAAAVAMETGTEAAADIAVVTGTEVAVDIVKAGAGQLTVATPETEVIYYGRWNGSAFIAANERDQDSGYGDKESAGDKTEETVRFLRYQDALCMVRRCERGEKCRRALRFRREYPRKAQCKEHDLTPVYEVVEVVYSLPAKENLI
ncbi:uncharacterized protein LOC129596302 [Paramacrobiotus metropolitanus]|uniref:uncharacterized protein LOC129596302 n=1 Tax=Paramacrobiotus metropolitanus TaxID=2943436 RepID=UPI002445D28B|nr:uncharacterized protein LOC129596302 [Paramacrobiotus metropolitanus]